MKSHLFFIGLLAALSVSSAFTFATTLAEDGVTELKSSSPAQKAPPSTLGVTSRVEANILWNGYYPPLAKRLPERSLIKTTDLVGERRHLFVSRKDFRVLEMDGSGSVINKDGEHKYGYRERREVWYEIPLDGLAMGNRQNALAPVRHVAADQKIYPYGSLVYVEEAKGHHFGNGPEMDGYFWVADVGGRIHGNHFDLFVGATATYLDFLHRPDRKKHYKTLIYKIPKAPKGYNPRKYSELKRLLARMNFIHLEQADRGHVFDALVHFQRAHPYIPEAEYGDPGAAITLWFLTQEAYKLKRERILSKAH